MKTTFDILTWVMCLTSVAVVWYFSGKRNISHKLLQELFLNYTRAVKTNGELNLLNNALNKRIRELETKLKQYEEPNP